VVLGVFLTCFDVPVPATAASSCPSVAAAAQEWRLRLTYLLLETLGMLRCSDMFDIVIDFPDSTPALSDLATCLQHTSLAGHFAATFRSALQARLLHAGAATSDIIHTYVSTIRAMQAVDSSGERINRGVGSVVLVQRVDRSPFTEPRNPL
jgi:anaphase-promoting complex subunit 2